MKLLAVALIAACGDNARSKEPMRSGARLELITYELADGTRDVDRMAFHDTDRDEDCTLVLLSSGERHCVPIAAGGTTMFSENSCRQAFGVAATEVPPEYFIRSFKLNGVTRPSRLYRPGPAIEAPAQRWEQQDSFCLGPYPVEPLFYFRLAEEIGAEDLVAVRTTGALSDERLSLAIDTSDDGWRMPGAHTDLAVEELCTLGSGANASETPCVPHLPTPSYYADADCALPLVTADRTLHHVQASGCSSLVARGGMIAGQVYEQLGESCVAVTAPPQTLYTAAGDTPLATLPRERLEPTGSRLIPIELTRGVVHERDVYFYDRDLDADCRIAPLGSGLACVPFAPVAPLTYFSDATCFTPKQFAFVPSGACDVPARFAADSTGLYRVGPVYPDLIYELTTGDRCAVYAPPARFTVHALEAIGPSALVRATRVKN